MKKYLVGLLLVCCIFLGVCSCKKNNPAAQKPRPFNPEVQGLAVKPMAQIDIKTAEFIANNKKAILAGEDVIPSIVDEEPTAAKAAPATELPAEAASQPGTGGPVAAQPGMPSAPQPAAPGAAPAGSPGAVYDPFSSDPNKSGNPF